MELFKGKGPTLQCKSYRDVLLSDVSGKLYHKALRSRISPFLDAMALDTQCGGIGSRGTDFGAHLVRQFVDLGRLRKKSVAVLFVDVVGAFASVIRKILIGGLADAEQVATICARLKLDHALGQEAVELARRDGVVAENGAPPHLAGLIREAHRNTWFSTEGLETIVKTTAGTRAGDPF